ncbi:MAG: hypothetical protein RL150_327 [Candidatus Parcubacteria bacterium]|jgi:hypothetical protein
MKIKQTHKTPFFTTIAVVVVIAAVLLIAMRVFEEELVSWYAGSSDISMSFEQSADEMELVTPPEEARFVPFICSPDVVAEIGPILSSSFSVLNAMHAAVVDFIKRNPCDVLPKQPELVSADSASRVLELDPEGWGVVVYTTDAFFVKVRATEDAANTPAINTLTEIMTTKLTEAGFTEKQQYPIRGAATPEETRNVSFSNGEERCVIESLADRYYESETRESYTIMGVNCFTQSDFENARREQMPFLSALGEKGVFLDDIKVVDGDKAKMGMTEGFGGGRGFMYKADGVWKPIVLWRQDAPDCSELASIPQEYWISCFDDVANEIRYGWEQ